MWEGKQGKGGEEVRIYGIRGCVERWIGGQDIVGRVYYVVWCIEVTYLGTP